MKLLLSFLLILTLFAYVFSAPLIFKTTKNIETAEKTDILELDTSKYKQIRIGITYKSQRKEQPKDFDSMEIYAVEEIEEMYLAGISVYRGDHNFSVAIDVPPEKIRIKVKGQGLYRIFVWGLQ